MCKAWSGYQGRQICAILNRVVEWTSEGLRYEADQRHAELILKDMGFKDNSKSVTTPGGKKLEDSSKRKLDKNEALQYRANVARANYLIAISGA